MKIYCVVLLVILGCQKEEMKSASLEKKCAKSLLEVTQVIVEKMADSTMAEVFDYLPSKEEYHYLLPLWDGSDSLQSKHKTFANHYVLDNVKHVARWMDIVREKKYQVEEVLEGAKVDPMGAYRLHRGLRQVLSMPNGEKDTVEIFKSAIELDGSYIPWSILDTHGN